MNPLQEPAIAPSKKTSSPQSYFVPDSIEEHNNNSNEKIYFTAESSKALLINNSKTFKPSNYEISTAKDEIKYQMLKKVKQRGTRYYYFSLATGIGAGAAFFAALAAEQGYIPSETIGEKTYAAAAIGLGAATWYGISKNDEAFMEQVAVVSRDITRDEALNYIEQKKK